MNSYELYNRVLSAANEDEGTFNACARNWIESGKDPNFKNDEANELFYAAKLACAAWRNKAINGRVSKLKMIECVRKITEKDLPNPYDPNEKDPEQQIAELVKEEVKEPEVKPVEEKKYVLGVPDEYADMGAEEPVVEKKEVATEEPKEEKRFFGKKKK